MDKDPRLKLSPGSKVRFHDLYSAYKENLAPGETLLKKRSFFKQVADIFKTDRVGGHYRIHGLAFTKTLRACY